MMTKLLGTTLGLFSVVVMGSIAAPVTAQDAAAEPAVPLLEHPTELRHAYALDVLSLYLDTLDVAAGSAGAEEEAAGEAASGAESAGETAPEEGEEEDEASLLDTGLTLLSGSLAQQDQALLGELDDALEATETGDTATVPAARELLAEAETVLIPEELAADTTFQAARMALLASMEPGVAEGYEEAAKGEDEAYDIGYAGLQRLEALWGGLEPNLSAAGDTENINRAFGVLDGLMAGPELPEKFSDPEDAETAANDIVFGLESLTGTSLIPRDFGVLLGAIETHLDEGCSAADAGDAQLALEWYSAAKFFYDAYLADTLGVLAADASGAIDDGLGDLLEDPESAEAPQRCEDVKAAIAEAQRVFGG